MTDLTDDELDFGEDEEPIETESSATAFPSLGITNPSVTELNSPDEKHTRHARIRYSPSSAERVSRPRCSNELQQRRKKNELYERRILHAKRFGIKPPREELTITEGELEDLYESMGISHDDNRVRLHSVLVRGIDNLTSFQVEKMFAEFAPSAVEMIDDVSCNVIWNDRFTVGKMMLEMTKPLKRVRGKREAEEGELAEGSDEEDGEMKEECGDEVTIKKSSKGIDGRSEVRRTTQDFVEVNMDEVNIPPGKWRVITKHVGQNRLIILRFSLREDLRKGRIGRTQSWQPPVSRNVTDEDGYSYKWMNKRNRVRPGINVFNEKGDELDWDYEHDTRFYVDLDAPEKEPPNVETSSPKRFEKTRAPSSVEISEVSVLGKRKVRSRGRGAKKLKSLEEILSGSSTMAADEEETLRNRRRAGYEDERSSDELSDGDLSDDRDPSPTPQPWDSRQLKVRLRVTLPNTKRKS